MEDSEINYIQLAWWVGHLGLGYGLARVHLSQVLGVEGDIMSRVTLWRASLPSNRIGGPYSDPLLD